MAADVGSRIKTGAELIDPTTLKSTADLLLAALEDAASDAGWVPESSCVTNGPPAVLCDSLYVWSDAINPIRDSAGPGCHVVLRTQFQYVVAVCVGLDPCNAEMAAKMHDTAWGVQAAFVEAVMTGQICEDVCSTVRFGTFTLLTNDGGFSWWQGSILIDLSWEELAS